MLHYRLCSRRARLVPMCACRGLADGAAHHRVFVHINTLPRPQLVAERVVKNHSTGTLLHAAFQPLEAAAPQPLSSQPPLAAACITSNNLILLTGKVPLRLRRNVPRVRYFRYVRSHFRSDGGTPPETKERRRCRLRTRHCVRAITIASPL